MKKILSLSLFFILFLSACNLQASQKPTATQDLSFDAVATSLPSATEQVVTTTTSDISTMANWTVIVVEPGLEFEKTGIKILREGETKNYAFVIDPNIAKITVRHQPETATFMNKLLMLKDSGADCGFSGPLFGLKDPAGEVMETYPIIDEGKLFPGYLTSDQGTKTLYIDNGKVWISDTASNDAVEKAQFAMSGVAVSNYYNKDTQPFNNGHYFYEVMAVKNNQLIVYASMDKKMEEIEKIMNNSGIASTDIVVINDVPQAGCFRMDYFKWNNLVGSALFVDAP